MLNGQKLEKVTNYKYLGMSISFHPTQSAVNYVKNICEARLKPLKVLANNGCGAGIPVLRTMYISTIRSIIDYAAPVLVSLPQKSLHTLEVVQNEAMRAILGCARTTRIEIMRMELYLPSILHRIKELIVAAVIRMTRRGDETLKSLLHTCQTAHSSPRVNKYGRKLYSTLLEYDAIQYCTHLKTPNSVPPWFHDKIKLDILRLNVKKDELCPLELRQIFLSKINILPKCNVVHMYCDGSVSGDKAGCGAVIREYFEETVCTDDHLSKRLGDFSSTTTAELQAIYEGLLIASLKGKDIYVFVDSQSALLSLNSVHNVNDALVSKCKAIIFELKNAGHIVQFMWIPSHIGICLNETADKLAKEALNKDPTDSEITMSFSRVKGVLASRRRQWDYEHIVKIMDSGSESMKHYVTV